MKVKKILVKSKNIINFNSDKSMDKKSEIIRLVIQFVTTLCAVIFGINV